MIDGWWRFIGIQMPEHSKHRRGCDCLNKTAQGIPQGQVTCPYCDPAPTCDQFGYFGPYGYETYGEDPVDVTGCDSPCLMMATFECDYWTTGKEKVAEPNVLLRMTCPETPCEYASYWWKATRPLNDAPVLRCSGCNTSGGVGDGGSAISTAYGSLNCPNLYSMRGYYAVGFGHIEVLAGGGAQGCVFPHFTTCRLCLTNLSTPAGYAQWSVFITPVSDYYFAGPCDAVDPLNPDPQYGCSGTFLSGVNSGDVSGTFTMNADFSAELQLDYVTVSSDCTLTTAYFSVNYTGQLSCSGTSFTLSFAGVVSGQANYNRLPLSVQRRIEDSITLESGTCGFPDIVLTDGDTGNDTATEWDHRCWWQCADVCEDSANCLPITNCTNVVKKHELIHTGVGTAVYRVRNRAGDMLEYTCSDYDCRGRNTFTCRNYNTIFTGMPKCICVEPVTFADIGNPCDVSFCDDGGATRDFLLGNITCTSGGGTLIAAGTYQFTRGAELPSEVQAVLGSPQGQSRCNYFWRTFDYSSGCTEGGAWAGQIGILIMAVDPQSVACSDNGFGSAYDDRALLVTIFCRDAYSTYQQSGQYCDSYQCCDPSIGAISFDVDCCCVGPPDCTCTPPTTLYVDTTGCDANWTGSGIAITFDGVDTWLVAGLGVPAYNAIELTCTGDQWVVSFAPNNASCDAGLTAAASGTCDPFYLEFSVPLDSICCGPSGGTLTVIISE